MKSKIASILFLSILGLSMSYARPIENHIIAYLEHTARSPMEIALMYDGKMLATVSYYGSESKKVGWLVQKRFLACENFEEEVPHLQVLRNDVPVNVVRYDCNPM